jgi:hypothetical protein
LTRNLIDGGVLVIGLQSAALSQDQDKSKAEKPKKPALYDPKADARTQIDAAAAKAKRQNARVLCDVWLRGLKLVSQVAQSVQGECRDS